MHKVYFVGSGPGDPDLLTIKAMKLIQKAETIVYSGSLLNPKILKYSKNAELHDASKLVREEIFEILKNSALQGKLVLRLHDGDPSIYGAIREQMDNLKKMRIDSVVVPGVSSVLASAASLGMELTLPGVTQTIIITRPESRTAVPKRERISELAKHRATMVFYLGVHLIADIVKEAIGGGYPISTPAAVVYKASWDDEKIIKGTLKDIVDKTRKAKITRTAIVIIGEVIQPKSYEYSRLYDKTFSHGFRKAKIKLQ